MVITSVDPVLVTLVFHTVFLLFLEPLLSVSLFNERYKSKKKRALPFQLTLIKRINEQEKSRVKKKGV